MAAWGVAGFRRVVGRGLGPVVSLALLVPMGVALWRAEPTRTCWDAPEEIAALAHDPRAATARLDPGPDTGNGTGAVADLLAPRHWVTCAGPSGPDLLGSILVAATTGQTVDDQDGPAVVHTEAMASVLYDIVEVLGAPGRDAVAPPRLRPWDGPSPVVPHGLEPYLATVLAAYVTDLVDPLDSELPLRTLADGETGEARSLFPFTGIDVVEVDAEDGTTTQSRHPALPTLVERIAPHPQAFAILHDAHRAYAAHYLDHLTVADGGELMAGVGLPPGTDGFEVLPEMTTGLVELAHLRGRFFEDGTIEDPAAFDAAVGEHSRGTYLAVADPPTLPVATGDLARRAPSPAAEVGDAPVLEGRDHLLIMLERWAELRGLPEAERVPLRALLSYSFTRGLDWTQWNWRYS
ncbi:hypothetical protein ACWC9S_01745 [Streptomyces xiamenensis]